MNLERFAADRDRESARACHQIYLSGWAADDPHVPPLSLRSFAGWMVCGWTEDPSETWLARDGAAALRLVRDHPAAAGEPASRRREPGGATPPGDVRAWARRCVRHAAGRADQHGRTVLASDTRDGSPGAAFAAALGARRGTTWSRRMLDMKAVPAGHLAALRAEAEPPAADTRCCPGPGRCPGSGSRRSPPSTRPWPTRRGTPSTRRRSGTPSGSGKTIIAGGPGLAQLPVAARSLATGELAGLTQVSVDPAEPASGSAGADRRGRSAPRAPARAAGQGGHAGICWPSTSLSSPGSSPGTLTATST